MISQFCFFHNIHFLQILYYNRKDYLKQSENFMKKFVISFFILLIFSLGVFFIGWSQFKVKPETIGILVSKTNGIQKNPIENGKFAWNWQLLLPTNANLSLFSIKPVSTNKTISGQLPSGALYTNLFGSNDDFSYQFDFSLSVTLSPASVVELYELNKILSNEDLQNYLEKACDTICQLSVDYFLKKLKENPNFSPLSCRRDDLLRSIKIYEEYPEIELSTFAVTYSKLPDFSLYQKLQNVGINSVNLPINENLQKEQNEIQNSNQNEILNENHFDVNEIKKAFGVEE